MFKYTESIRNHFKNYHFKNGQLLAVFLDSTGNTVIRVYDAATFITKRDISLGCKTFNIFFYPGDDILAYFPLQRLVRVDLQTGEIQINETVKFAPELLFDNSLFGISVDEFSNKFLARMDLTTNEIRTLIEEPFRLWGSNGQSMYGVKAGMGQKIYSIDPISGSINWCQNFSADLSGRILPDDGIVVVFGHTVLFGVNTADGEVVWRNESVNSLTNFYDSTLINVTNNKYREISPRKGEILAEHEMKPEYEKHGFRFMGTNSNFTVTDTHIFIVDAMGYMMGCINRNTGKIDWSVKVGEGKVTLPHAPIIYGDKLYVLDDEGTLHVFDRE